MNIVKREIRVGLKPFLFWLLGLFFLDVVGMMKFTVIEASAGSINVMDLMNQFPRVVLAVFGMSGVDINTLGGYYAIIAFYSLICIAIYAIHLGNGGVNRESIDKTYEFVFTKPCKREYILKMKLWANLMYLFLLCVFHVLFSIIAVLILNINENINVEMIFFGLSAFLVGLLFFSLGAFFAAITKRAEKGAFYSNVTFLIAFILGVVYDMLEKGTVIRFLTPLKYFLPKELLNRELNSGFIVLCLVETSILIYMTFKVFYKKDLTGVN